MKTIGLVGGMSWKSTALYYEIINQEVNKRLGQLNSAKIVMYSVNFEEIEVLQHANKWNELTDIMIDVAQRVERGGADLVLITTNTMHKMADRVQDNIGKTNQRNTKRRTSRQRLSFRKGAKGL